MLLGLKMLRIGIKMLRCCFRYTTVDKAYNVPVTVSGVSGFEAFKADLHPKNPEVGTKTVWRSPTLLIDGADAETLKVCSDFSSNGNQFSYG